MVLRFYHTAKNVHTIDKKNIFKLTYRALASLKINIDMDTKKENQDEINYENAITTLNTLQTNASVIARIDKENGNDRISRQQRSLPEMNELLSRIDLDASELDKLNVIHISGTKGKGSVASFCESMLRQCGLTTGFYSSPHIVEVRERIRLNGLPLEKNKFARYFFECYNKLMQTANVSENKMPGYFRFLTLMSFYVFLKEKLDVVVMEVGIGGAFDSTNIIKNPSVSGITMLELDHISMLGDTIQQIAWHKSGIMKEGRPTLALPQNYHDAEEVLFRRANELKSTLQIVPALEKYENSHFDLGISGEHQASNASLALQLCRVWLHENKASIQRKDLNIRKDLKDLLETPVSADTANNKIIDPFKVPATFLKGLRNTKWPGRCEVIQKNDVTFYLDGAHTPGSIMACIDWLNLRIDKDIHVKREHVFRVLMFNINKTRDHVAILRSLSNIGFDYALFCPNVIEADDNSEDLKKLSLNGDDSFRMCERNQATWHELNLEKLTSNLTTNNNKSLNNSAVFPTISSSVRWLFNGRDKDIEKPDMNGVDVPLKMRQCKHTQVVVVGSLYLVGGLIKYLGPLYESCKVH